MTTKLQIYNTALRYCKERPVTLTENREPRRLLDAVWADGGVDLCLEEALWKFAIKAVRIDYDPSVVREFGFTYAFEKPSDWKMTAAVCSDEYYSEPLLRYAHENGYWYSDLDTLYVKFVSNAVDYGYDLSIWPQSFSNYVSAHFANEIVDKLSGGNEQTVARVERHLKDNKANAKNRDAMNQPQLFPAPGNWVRSRSRLRGDNRDRGNRGSLIG